MQTWLWHARTQIRKKTPTQNITARKKANPRPEPCLFRFSCSFAPRSTRNTWCSRPIPPPMCNSVTSVQLQYSPNSQIFNTIHKSMQAKVIFKRGFQAIPRWGCAPYRRKACPSLPVLRGLGVDAIDLSQVARPDRHREGRRQSSCGHSSATRETVHNATLPFARCTIPKRSRRSSGSANISNGSARSVPAIWSCTNRSAQQSLIAKPTLSRLTFRSLD